jgi:hypothetical protein
MIQAMSLLFLILSSTVAYSYVLGPVPQEPRVSTYSTSVRPPLTDEGCDDCIKNYYSEGVQEDLIRYHERQIWGENGSNKDDSVE